jgi:hypothetical protein
MSGKALTTATTLTCPHQATIKVTTKNQKAKAGDKLITDADTFTISGCQNKLPGTPPIPSPCVQVIWVLPDLSVKVGSGSSLSTGSLGLCLAGTGIPQGKVTIGSTQGKVSTK